MGKESSFIQKTIIMYKNMYKKNSLKISILIIATLFFVLPQSSFAAQISFKNIPNTTVGDNTTIVEVRINPENKKLNVVEGVVSFKGIDSSSLAVQIETGGSVLTLWPTPPEYFAKEKAIRFVGGVPKGFDTESLLFRIRLASSVAGNLDVIWSGGRAYLNDGLGTEEPIYANSSTISLEAQDISNTNKSSVDNTPPTFENTEVGKDPSVYDGKYFISLQATDDTSGISKYQVEENGVVTEVTDGVYILKDQSRSAPINITAYDNAGNTKTIKISPRFNFNRGVILLLVIIILYVVIFNARKRFIKK